MVKRRRRCSKPRGMERGRGRERKKKLEAGREGGSNAEETERRKGYHDERRKEKRKWYLPFTAHLDHPSGTVSVAI